MAQSAAALFILAVNNMILHNNKQQAMTGRLAQGRWQARPRPMACYPIEVMVFGGPIRLGRIVLGPSSSGKGGEGVLIKMVEKRFRVSN